MRDDERTPEQKRLDAANAAAQDAADMFAHMAEVMNHVALRFRLLGDPTFMARPTPAIVFSLN